MLRKIFFIAQKELSTLFHSPLAYIIGVVVMTIFNGFFYIILEQGREATLRDMFQLMEFLFVFIIPLLTMKTLSEEKMTGTIEFLMTSPTSEAAIVLGKYLGCLCFYSLILMLTGIYYLILEIFSSPDQMAAMLGYSGLWLEGALFIAVGVMTSAWSRSQVACSLCAYLILFFGYFSKSFSPYVSGTFQKIISYVNVTNHSANFYDGLLITSDLVYFLSGVVLCLWITQWSMKRQWE